MIEIPLWLYLISLIVVVFITYHIVDFIYFQKYMEYRAKSSSIPQTLISKISNKYVDTLLKVYEFMQENKE